MTVAGSAPAEASEGLSLALPEEPEDLRRKLAEAVLEGGSLHEAVGGEGGVGTWLWERWRAELEPAGFGPEAFLDVVGGYRREVWFWLLGDRGWAQVVAGLSGRLARRLPAS